MKPGAIGNLAGGAPALTPEQTRARDAAKAGKQLEAFFLRQLLSETRPQGGGALDGGFAGDTFKQMLDDAIADKMSAAGGIGLASMFARQLEGTGGVAPAAAITAALPRHGLPLAQPASPAALPLPARAAGPELPGAPHFILPVSGRPSSGYGLRADPIHGGEVNHPGFDLAAPAGTGVAAAAGGTVVHAGPAGTYGNLVTLRHGDGFETRYAHLSEVDVNVGDVVQAGTPLGKVGSTGYSTGPHLHFEVRRDGAPIDPAPLLPLNSSAPRTMR